MRKPLAPKTPIDGRRINRWIAGFPGYHAVVAQMALEAWIKQFKACDRDLAARVIDAVVYITAGEIRGIYKNLLDNLDGWHRQKARRTGNWFFVPFSRTSGESGDGMTHLFRMANNMNNRFFDSEFIHPTQLLQKMPGPEDTVVLIDDFAGTGRQACGYWNNSFQELLPNSPRVILMLIGATNRAVNIIEEKTDMRPICGKVFYDRDNFFAAACKYFTAEEKASVLKYCQQADPENPKGYGACGLLVVLAHQCPNNSLPILHGINKRWYGVFPRK